MKIPLSLQKPERAVCTDFFLNQQEVEKDGEDESKFAVGSHSGVQRKNLTTVTQL